MTSSGPESEFGKSKPLENRGAAVADSCSLDIYTDTYIVDVRGREERRKQGGRAGRGRKRFVIDKRMKCRLVAGFRERLTSERRYILRAVCTAVHGYIDVRLCRYRESRCRGGRDNMSSVSGSKYF